MNQFISKLVALDELQDWGGAIPELKGDERRNAFATATPLWIERMVRDGKLLLHPSVIAKLTKQNWIPDELQKQMIWASIVCKLDSDEQKSEKARIRELIKKRYSNEWWEQVYARAGRVWPAWDRYRKNILSAGPGIAILSIHSSLVGQAMNDEFKAVLKMVPES